MTGTFVGFERAADAHAIVFELQLVVLGIGSEGVFAFEDFRGTIRREPHAVRRGRHETACHITMLYRERRARHASPRLVGTGEFLHDAGTKFFASPNSMRVLFM